MPIGQATSNGTTSIIGLIMLGMMAYGTRRYGFFRQFDTRYGRTVMLLGLFDLMGLLAWH